MAIGRRANGDKLEAGKAGVEAEESGIKVLEDSGATGLASYVKQAQQKS